MRAKYVGAVLATLAAIPFVAARDLNLGFGGSSAASGIGGAVSRIYEIIASFFNVPLSPNVLEGLMKFFFFLIIFSVSFWAMRRTIFRDGNGANDGLNRKTAGIIALAFALISVWFIPGKLFTDMTSIYPALFVLLLILAPAIALTIGAFYLVSREGNQQPTISQHALGALMIGTAWGYTLFWHEQVPKYVAAGQFINIIDIVLAWVLIALPIAFIVKLIQTLLAGVSTARGGAGGAGGGADDGHGWLGRFARRTADQANSLRDSWRRFRTVPSIISNVNFEQVGPNSVRLSWQVAPNEENAIRYELRQSSQDLNIIAQGTRDNQLNNPDGTIVTNLTPVNHPQAFVVLNGLNVANRMMFAVRAVNNTNTNGPWGLSPYKLARDPVVNAPSYARQLNDARDARDRARRLLQNAQRELVRLGTLDAVTLAPSGNYMFVAPGQRDAILDLIDQAADNCATADAALNGIRGDARYADITIGDRTQMVAIDGDIAMIINELYRALGGAYALL